MVKYRRNKVQWLKVNYYDNSLVQLVIQIYLYEFFSEVGEADTPVTTYLYDKTKEYFSNPAKPSN